MARLVCDLETNGLLQEVTKIHCASIVDADGSFSELFVGDKLKDFMDLISKPENELIWHNGFAYDLPVLKKLLNWTPYKDQKIHDTLVLSQLLFSDLYADDEKKVFFGQVFSKKDYGSHSLKAWGQRLHCFKGEYNGGWEAYNEDMGKYCIQDTFTGKALFTYLESKIPDKLVGTEAIDLEYSIAPILARQQNYGVQYNDQKAMLLVNELRSKVVDLSWKLQEVFKPRYVSEGEFTPKVNNKNGYRAGCTFTKIKLQEFNPNSRQQIVDRLKLEFGWDPTEFTDKGNAKMDEEIIDALPYPEMQPLKEYLQTKSVLAKLVDGKNSWDKHLDKDGRIRGAIRQNGAVTGRMTHFKPNLAQVPSEKKLYGKECRELFVASPGKVIIGMDADAIEMRILAGYLFALDGGKFRDEVLKGKKEEGTDSHTLNMISTNLPSRDCAKTQFYGDVYGSGNAKKGKILLEYGVDLKKYVPDFQKEFDGFKAWAKEKNINFTDKYIECAVAGKQYTRLFGDRLPALPALKEKIKNLVKERGWVKGLDGRKLFCRTERSQLNTVCQSAGALIMKKALSIADLEAQEKGLLPGIDYEFILNIHDEFEVECIDNCDKIDIMKNILGNCVRKAGEYFNFPCELKGNVQVGKNWGEVH